VKVSCQEKSVLAGTPVVILFIALNGEEDKAEPG
jgi:hypothetical protein